MLMRIPPKVSFTVLTYLGKRKNEKCAIHEKIVLNKEVIITFFSICNDVVETKTDCE